MMKKLFGIIKKFCSSVIFSLLILCLGILHTEGFAATKDRKNMQPAGQVKKIEEYQKRLAKLLTPVVYRYNPAGKPDPFMPFFRTSTKTRKQAVKSAGKKKKHSRCNSPLECMDVGQLTLVGIVLEKNGSPLAMVQDASGIGYTLKPGMKIGSRHGSVAEIDKEKVIIREQTENIKGELTYRERILFLHPEESNEAQ